MPSSYDSASATAMDEAAAAQAAAAAENDGGGGEAPSGVEVKKRGVRDDYPTPSAEYDEFNKKLKRYIERFDESTYNKHLGKLMANRGDKTITSDSVVATVRKCQGIVNDAVKFLSRLYNAPATNLWYRPDENDELYTDLKPDYRQIMRKKYGENLKSIRNIDRNLKRKNAQLRSIDRGLSEKIGLIDREPLL